MYAAGLHYYLRSYWNVLDICSIVLMLVIIPFHALRIGVGQRQVSGPPSGHHCVRLCSGFRVHFSGCASVKSCSFCLPLAVYV